MDDSERFKIVEGICLALSKINLLNSYVYKLAEFIDRDNPDIVIGDIEQLMNEDTEIEEIAIRLRFRNGLTKKINESDKEDRNGQIERATQGVVT